MASLKRPMSPCNCGSDYMLKKRSPERWVCGSCDAVLVSRKLPPDPSKCRVCGIPRNGDNFHPRKNLCKQCYNDYNKNWRLANPEHWRNYRHATRKARQEVVRKSISRSPVAFLTYLISTVRRRCRGEQFQKLCTLAKMNPACGNVDIIVDDLVAIWESQAGRCALSGLPMLHELNHLQAISIDRKDSSLGYTKGNVQLVCQWVNKAKGNHSDAEMLAIIDLLKH